VCLVAIGGNMGTLSEILVAIGGNMGTLSEMAMGLKWGKPVFVMHGDVALPGAVQVAGVDDMLTKVLDCLLA